LNAFGAKIGARETDGVPLRGSDSLAFAILKVSWGWPSWMDLGSWQVMHRGGLLSPLRRPLGFSNSVLRVRSFGRSCQSFTLA